MSDVQTGKDYIFQKGIEMEIECCALSDRGKIRRENQDRVFVNDINLHNNKSDTFFIRTLFRTNDCATFAIFDGMGGELCGSHASQLALDTISKRKVTLMNCDLSSVCMEINERICYYMQANKIHSMGTTAVIACITPNYLRICNIGDSRAYRVTDMGMEMLTVDHVMNIGRAKKRRVLNQYLGIPRTEMLIEPYEACVQYMDGDIIVLCSDGLTDLVTEEKIYEMFQRRSLESACTRLYKLAIQNGGRDNISIIACKVNL